MLLCADGGFQPPGPLLTLVAAWEAVGQVLTTTPGPHGSLLTPHLVPFQPHIPGPQAELLGRASLGSVICSSWLTGPTTKMDGLGAVTRAWKRPYLGCAFLVLVSDRFDPGILQQRRVLRLGPGDGMMAHVSSYDHHHSRQPALLTLTPINLGGQPPAS